MRKISLTDRPIGARDLGLGEAPLLVREQLEDIEPLLERGRRIARRRGGVVGGHRAYLAAASGISGGMHTRGA